MYDCIVVGAGVAGATAAYHLAKRGLSVLIVEKETLARPKPCAGGVSPAIAQWFDFDLSPAISRKVTKVRYTWKREDPVEIELQTAEPMWVVRREVFDRFLVQQAQQQGTELRENTEVRSIEFKGDRWQISTNSDPLEARYTIAADGASGPMAKWLGLKPAKTRSGVSLDIPDSSPDEAIRFEFGSIKNGSIWTFPNADGYALGIGTLIGGDSKKLPKILTDYATKVGLNANAGQVCEHSLSLWDGDRKLHAQNALLVGDAANVADPLTAEGIRPSILSGVKAAEAIANAVAGDISAIEQYTQVMAKEWGSEMAWASRLAGAFYRFPGIGYKVAIKQPKATQIMLQILCGELRYSDVTGRALKRLSGGFLGG
jgi:geranylgeranyl reductase family protein